MLAVTEHIPVGLETILRPRSTGVDMPDRLATRTGLSEWAWFPSCRAAIRHALVDAGIESDDEVILPAYTCYAVAQVVDSVATPVYADVTSTGLLDIDAVGDAVSSATVAILPTHLYGFTCDIADLAEIADDHDLLVIEDAAQALANALLGETVGRYGDYCAFSFRFYKEVTSYTGGLLLGASGEPTEHGFTDDRWRLVTAWLMHRLLSSLPGRLYQPLRGRVLDPLARRSSNSASPSPPRSIDEWTRRILGAQLAAIEDRVATRRLNAAIYREALPDGLRRPPEQEGATYFRYPIRVPDGERDGLLSSLRRRGIGCSPMYSYTVAPSGTCPMADRVADQMLNLPVHAGLTRVDIERIVEEVAECWESL